MANNTSTSTITATLKDYDGVAVAGKTVTLASSRGAIDTISAASGPSNATGAVTFTVKSLTTGTAVLTATDTTDNVVVVQTATVTFTGIAVAQTYGIAASTDVAQDFSPMNLSGHPVVTGLNNYPNSTAPKAMVAAQMKAPWNVNVGTQTMMCSDCHTSDAATPAAQGPHGSASQFMLRGPNAANWPNVILSSGFATSWCANCHNNSAGEPHTRDKHSARRCYECHIVIPHGGKLSRLIADGNSPNMPSRYAYNNDPNLVQVTGFTKKTTGNYSKSDCGAKCETGDHPLTNGGQW